MASITTAQCNSYKKELMQGYHNWNASVTPTGNTTSGSNAVSGVSSMSGVVAGMSITGTPIPANTVITQVTSATSFTMNNNASATNTGATLTITGDPYYMALINGSYTGTYDANITNYGSGTGAPSTSNVGTDEVSNGSGYTTGGALLTNVTPALGSGVAYTTPSPSGVSWTSATFTTVGCIIYNKSTRAEFAGGRAVSVHSFGGSQTVSGGTLTVLTPTNNSSSALLRLS